MKDLVAAAWTTSVGGCQDNADCTVHGLTRQRPPWEDIGDQHSNGKNTVDQSNGARPERLKPAVCTREENGWGSERNGGHDDGRIHDHQRLACHAPCLPAPASGLIDKSRCRIERCIFSPLFPFSIHRCSWPSFFRFVSTLTPCSSPSTLLCVWHALPLPFFPIT